MNSNTSSDVSNMGLKFKKCLLAHIIRSPSSTFINSRIAACVVNVLFSLVGTILNTLVLYIFWKSPQRRSKISYFGIMLMSSLDLAVVTIVQLLYISFRINAILEQAKCLHLMAFAIAAYIFTGMSMTILVTINIERYFSIVRPVLHRTMATKKRFLLTCVLIWFVQILMTVCWFLFSGFGSIGSAIFYFLTCVTSFFVYLSIFFVARKKLRNVHPVNNTSGQDTSNNRMSFLRELKLAKTYVLVVLLCFLCYLPYGIVLANNLVDRNVESIDERGTMASTWTVTLVLINSTLNCCVFFWANRELRKEGLKVVRKCFGERYGR